MRQVAHEAMHPDEDFAKRDGERAADEPRHAFFIGHLPGEDGAGEINHGGGGGGETGIESRPHA